jgi:branched-chain amino acid transport system ATP-binding protein
LDRRASAAADSASRALLSVEDVSAGYGEHRVLSDVTFAVEAGEFVCLIGPNGSGKSTLLRMLMNLLPPTGGQVFVDGIRSDHLSTPDLFRLGVGMTFQLPRVFAELSLLDNMLVAKHGRGGTGSTRHEAMEALDSVGLAAFARRRARELSVGQQKLLDLARVALTKPRLFLLDEVTAGVHPDLVPVVLDVVKRSVGSEAAALLVTHEMGIARTYCDRVLALDNGTIVADGKPEDVFADQRVVEAYIGA